ncbi:MAG: GNAT family N-acetyltransferase, partial [Actinobacteria bacterium]|nr:GNAT family N-acetyltransferase [Actinomycetota bacterium]
MGARLSWDGAVAIVRPAREHDVAQLAEFYRAAHEELVGARGGRVLLSLHGRPADVEASFARELLDPEHQVVLALVGPQGGLKAPRPVGYGTCRASAMEGGEMLGSIEELYVSPDARRLGAGRALALSLFEWCQAQGCT